MYVTRPLSMYWKSPSTLSIHPPDAPHSGFMVITDEDAEAHDASCWRLCKRRKVSKLPFPTRQDTDHRLHVGVSRSNEV
ncbi:hypothetical protein ACFX2A_024346 [Malus domestica]